MLPPNLQNINFDWIVNNKYHLNKSRNEMVNNIPNYYHVEIFLSTNILSICCGKVTIKYGPKWPIHVVDYKETKWSSEIYEIQDKYYHPNHGYTTILINMVVYQPYSSTKSALK